MNIDTVVEQAKPKTGRPRKDDPHRITPEKITKAMIAAGGNKTKAYKILRPNSGESNANSSMHLVINNSSTQSEARKTLELNDLSLDDLVKASKTALYTGLGVNATNKDSVNMLKFMIQMHTGNIDVSNDFTEQSKILESSKHDEVMGAAADIQRKLDVLLRGNAIEPEADD